MSKPPDLSDIRGMSEPFFFSANVLDKGRKVLVHAVIFTSFEVPGAGEEDVMICSLDVDPRMRAFVQFVLRNQGQEGVKVKNLIAVTNNPHVK